MKKKKTIIILHGWGSSPQSWQKVADLLRQNNYSVEVPSLPGFIKSLDKPYTLNDYVRWLDQYIKKNKLEKLVVVGHSNGGRIASYFCATSPNRVEKLILIDAAGIPPKNTLKRYFFKFLSEIGKAFLKMINNDKLLSSAQKLLYKLARESDYLNASPVMKKTMINLISYDLTEDFTKIKCPTLCIWGRHDSYTPLWMGKRIHQLIKNSQLIVVDDARHGIHLTHPGKLTQLITKFIKV